MVPTSAPRNPAHITKKNGNIELERLKRKPVQPFLPKLIAKDVIGATTAVLKHLLP